MGEPGRCSSCGLPLDLPGPEGLCPTCLLRMGLVKSVAPGATAAASGARRVGPVGRDDADATRLAPGDAARGTPPSSLATAGVPSVIGPYHLLQALGEGGMGLVYLAEQREPLVRRVALKLIKPGMDTREVVSRFEAERQTLAIMDHENIASVFDAGTTADGRPYFVMEYIAGVPLTDYCDTHYLSTRQRLELFIEVCAAIQHAHQKGIIHRDLKPSNVLVVEQDGRAVPKVIDFGIAKGTDQRATERTLFTQQGMLVGTPEYMSPEQATLGAVDLDTRTDIYSLGVMLYELLVGGLPFSPTRLREAGYGELIRIIREEEPARPSTRLTTAGATGSEVAKRRRTKLPTLAQELRGDLDWITLKALEKDRARRYATVSELSADLTRYLKNEPVVARPPSVRYRVQKFVRRNRLAVTAAGVVAAAVLAGLVASSLLYVRAERARGEAVAQRTEAERQRSNAEAARRDASNKAASEARARAAADAAASAERMARSDADSQRRIAQDALADAEQNLYFNNIALADREWASGDLAHVDQLLAEAPARLRGWEWHHLSRLSHMEDAAIPVSSSAIAAVQVDAKTGRFFVATTDLRVAIGDVKTWRVSRIVRLAGPPLVTMYVAVFSPDGRRLAARLRAPLTDSDAGRNSFIPAEIQIPV